MSDKTENTLVQLGRPEKKEARHVNLPIELGSTMVFDTMAAFEQARDNRYHSGTMFYGRYGNEASYKLEGIIAALEHAAGVTLTSSGVAAISLALQAQVKPDVHLLVADNVYGNTRAFCEGVLRQQGVVVEFFDAAIGTDIKTLFRSNTVAVMFEAPGTGTFEFPDISGIAAVSKKAGVVSILDATWATPVFCQPLTLGVDVLVYSGSKYLSGHSDCMFGVIACKAEPLHKQIRQCVMAYGDKIGSHEVFLALRGMRTLDLRMKAANEAGLKVAKWFAERPEVARVLHPALNSCPGHDHWKASCSGSAGLFSVVFHPVSDVKIHAFTEALHHFGIGVSWGGFESLVLPVKPVRTATEWSETGQLVRFNIGLENTQSLIDDLDSAMAHLA